MQNFNRLGAPFMIMFACFKWQCSIKVNVKVNLMPEGGPFKAQAVKLNKRDSATKMRSLLHCKKRMKSCVCRVHHSESAV